MSKERKSTINGSFNYGEFATILKVKHFKPDIVKASEACKNSRQVTENHFEELLEMVKIGSSAERTMEDGIKLSRHACYLIV